MDHSSSLRCELRIIKAKNIDAKYSASQGGVLFVRCYLSAGNSTRVKLDSKQMTISPSECADHTIITWDQTFSLDCLGSKESIERLEQETLVLELRRRSTAAAAAPLIGRLRGSKLIGKAEIPWRTLLGEMEIEKWVVMIPQNGRVINYDDDDDVMLPAVQIAMKIQESSEMIRKRIGGGGCDEGYCGCVDGGHNNSCVDYEFFAIEAALEAL